MYTVRANRDTLGIARVVTISSHERQRIMKKFLVVLALACTVGSTIQPSVAAADVTIATERHPSDNLLSDHFTFFTNSTLYVFGNPAMPQFFGAGTNVAFPRGGGYTFANDTVISYDGRHLYDIPAGTYLALPNVEEDPSPAPGYSSGSWQDSNDDPRCVLDADGRTLHCSVDRDSPWVERDERERNPCQRIHVSTTAFVSGRGHATASGYASASGAGGQVVAFSSASTHGGRASSSASASASYDCD